ncbi:tumor necrosis factor receptor superfamily member 11B [Ambystoma mexicanum]|uniref:tumor necrosis factor receptor superfamily member 11B n=1 Tax=Ambystoma mexicanum TaxID=8296 RepID=UPI0037E7929A
MGRLLGYTLALFNFAVTWTTQEIPPPKYLHQDPETAIQLHCDQCPPGTYVLNHCTARRRTECAPCPAHYYSEHWHFGEECLYCGNVCKEMQYVKQDCNGTHSQVCECMNGWYLDLEFCLQHRKCPSGFGVLLPGTPERDTVCERCPHGFFSHASSATETCQRHTDCGKLGLTIVFKGNSTHDSICQHNAAEHSSSKCDIDITLCEEALFRFAVPTDLSPNWLSILMQTLPGMKMHTETIEVINKRYDSHERMFQLLKLWKSQNKGQNVVRKIIKDIDICENAVINHIGLLNLTLDHLMRLKYALPGKKLRQDIVENIVDICPSSMQILKLLSLWRIHNGNADTVQALRSLKLKHLPKELAQRLKKLVKFLNGIQMYRLYQKLFLEIVGNQMQSLKNRCLT